MEAELARLRETFSASAREHLALVTTALERLAVEPTATDALKVVRLQFHWLANWAVVHGFPDITDAARAVDLEVTRILLMGAVCDADTVTRWKGIVTSALSTLSAAEAARWDGVGPSRFLVFTKRANRFAAPLGARGPLDTACCEVVDDLETASKKVQNESIIAVILDLAAPIEDLLSLVRRTRAIGGPWRPIPPIVGLSEGLGVLDRFRITQAGVNAIVPANAPEIEITRAVQKVIRETVVYRGTVFMLGGDQELRERLEKDVTAEGFLFFAFGDLQELLRKWIEHAPDVILVCTLKGATGLLKVVREIRDDEHSDRLPIVVISDRFDLDSRKAVFESGATDWLPYPYSSAELYTRVRDVVDLRALLSTTFGPNVEHSTP